MIKMEAEDFFQHKVHFGMQKGRVQTLPFLHNVGVIGS